MNARRIFGLAKILDFHLLEFARAKRKVAGRDFIAERFADLRDAERQFFARRIQHIREIDEDALRGFGAQIRDVGIVIGGDRADVRFEHQVELARFGQRAFAAAVGTDFQVLQMIGAKTRFATFAIYQRIVKSRQMAGCFPDFRVHQN